MRMSDVDATIRKYNAERLVEAGVMSSVDEVGTYTVSYTHLTLPTTSRV